MSRRGTDNKVERKVKGNHIEVQREDGAVTDPAMHPGRGQAKKGANVASPHWGK